MVDEKSKEGYLGFPANFIMADTQGNIGYLMLVTVPIRKDSTPYLGARVLDGTVSDWDWVGYVPSTQLPRSVNPKRGYIVTANNRQVSDHAKYDYGAASMSPARS